MATEIIPPTDPNDKTTVVLPPGSAPDEVVYREDKPDAVFSQYAICGKIGDGGMGVVYLAKDRRLNRYVAIKRLNAASLAKPALRERFLQEARAVAALNHVNIVHIYSLGEDENGPYIIMEYVGGPDANEIRREGSQTPSGPARPLTLDAYVLRHGQMTLEEAIPLLIRLGKAIEYAHSCGVIHRDLKPSNVLLDKNLEPKICDFGLARLENKEESEANRKLTVPGEKLLSLGYSAPEQERDASTTDIRSDVYGLGAILYFCLTAKNPRYFREQEVQPSVREVLVKALATERESRWSSVVLFVEALQAVLNKAQIEQPTVKKTWRCKWCDTVNPIETHYCVECGWEGAENCPECGAETFIGVQYCTVCGADRRAYEGMAVLLERMAKAMEDHRFERVVSYAGRVHGFEPAGQKGRDLLQRVLSFKEQAEQKILRRNRLVNQIPLEFKAENYERTLAFIRELRELNENPDSFKSEEDRIPGLILARDLDRANRLMRNKDWGSAKALVAELSRSYGSDNAECRALAKRIATHFTLLRIRQRVAVVLLVLAIYSFLLPCWIRFSPEGRLPRVLRVLYRPAKELYRLRPMAFYASALLRPGAVEKAFEPPMPKENALGSEPLPPLPAEIVAKRTEFERQVADIDTDQRVFKSWWAVEYQRELEAGCQRVQPLGDFKAWEGFAKEIKRFDSERTLDVVGDGLPPDVTDLQKKYLKLQVDQRVRQGRRYLSAARRYLADLTEARKVAMQGNQMGLATVVNEEMKRVRSLPDQAQAEKLLASVESESSEVRPTLSVSLVPVSANGGTFPELERIRDHLEEGLVEIEKKFEEGNRGIQQRYLDKLAEVARNYQKMGDFENYASVCEEMQRFEADRALGSQHVVDAPQKLADVQAALVRELTQSKSARAKAVVDAFGAMLGKLESLQKELTQQGKMEYAAAVNTTLKSYRSRKDYLDAQSECAEKGKGKQAGK